MTTLTIDEVTVSHGRSRLVDAADLRLEPGVPLTVVGESGSGKSLLAHALMGTLPGELRVTGRMALGGTPYDLATRPGRGLWGSRLAMLPQEPSLALDPTMRVRPQVAEGASVRRPGSRAARRAADRALDGLGLADAAHAWPHQLSGGMAQRVAYAAATVGGVDVLIVDEPSKGLDEAAVDRIADLLTAHLARGGLLLTITHDLRLARRLGGELLVMQGARVVDRGPGRTLLDEPTHDYTRALVAAEPTRWKHEWMATTRDPGASPEPLVSASGVTKGYGATTLFRDLSLEIGTGERWALVGPSGVGKTTLGNALLGLAPVDHGEVRHHPALAPGRAQKLYQDPVLSFPRRVALGTALGDVLRRHGVDRKRPERLMESVGLAPDLLARRPDQLSGGELQRLAVVRAMLLRPALVFADEPTSRLDLLSQERTMDCLMTEVDASGCALVLVTHDHGLAAAVTDRQVTLGAQRGP